MKRLMVPFFCLLLLSSLMVPLIPAAVAAAESEPVLIAGNPLVVAPDPDWDTFWTKLHQYAKWNLEWYDGTQWVNQNADLTLVRSYQIPNREKLTLVFDASHAGNYRLTFAINKVVKDYVTRFSEYAYELNYDNFSLVWDWSDAIGIPGLVFTHGLLNDMFWFRMRRDNVPLGAHVEIDPTLIASYEDHGDLIATLKQYHPSAGALYSAASQSFVNINDVITITQATFWLRKVGLPTGNASAVLYTHAGVYGTSSVPTGVALATSDPIGVDNFTSNVWGAAYTFTFSTGFDLQPNVNYVIAFQNPTAGNIDTSNYVDVVGDGAGTYGGNLARYRNSAWAAVAAYDAYFIIYGVTPEPEITSTDANTAFSTGEYGWVNVTITEAKGVANLNRVDLYVNTTGAAQNFSLRWTQATDVFSEQTDPDGICEMLNSVRENIDAYTDKICFRFRFTGTPAEGDCDVRVYVLNDDALDDTQLYPALFAYVGIEWNLIADLINSAFSLFGIMGYMTQITAFITSISGQFVNSLIQLATLINLQFQVIWAMFAWWLGWANRIIAAVLNFGNQLQMILNGTHPLLAGPVNLWNYFNFASAGQAAFDVAPLFFIVYWINSMGKRARTQGSLQVLYGDLSSFANVFAYFMGAFSMVIGFIEGKISWLISALP